eukprot:gene15798-biopygen9704
MSSPGNQTSMRLAVSPQVPSASPLGSHAGASRLRSGPTSAHVGGGFGGDPFLESTMVPSLPFSGASGPSSPTAFTRAPMRREHLRKDLGKSRSVSEVQGRSGKVRNGTRL